MTGIFAHRGKALCLAIRLDCRTNIAQMLPHSRLLDTQFHAAFRYINQTLRLAIYRTNRKRLAAIAHPPIIMDANINADNITFAQCLFCAGNTMTDNIIDCDANRRRKWRYRWLPAPGWRRAVANVARNSPLAANKLLGDFVQFAG